MNAQPDNLFSATASDTYCERLHVLRNEWASTPLSLLPRAVDGLRLLDVLLCHPTSIPTFHSFIPFQDVYSGEAPSYSHVVADFLYADEVQAADQGLRGFVDGVKKDQILASWLQGPYVRKMENTTRLYSILDLPFHKKGSGRCQIKIPDRFLVDGVKEKHEGIDLWGTSMCPAGTLTDIHFDYCGPAQLMVSIRGRKLWLLWPPSPQNLMESPPHSARKRYQHHCRNECIRGTGAAFHKR